MHHGWRLVIAKMREISCRIMQHTVVDTATTDALSVIVANRPVTRFDFEDGQSCHSYLS